MTLILSLSKNYLPALMLSLYIYSFWILPQNWNEDNILDGSWRYALGKFRELGFSLGRDSWFTYGPVAHWFGAPMGGENYQPFPYYVLGLFVAGVIGITFVRLCDALGLSFRLKVIVALVFPFSFIGMEGALEIHLNIALFLLFLFCCLQEQPDNTSIFSMIILSACGLLYKISFGILALFTMAVLLLSLLVRGKISGTRMLLCLAGYVAILYVMFVATSGSYDLITYIRLGLETSGKYSEIMIRNMPYSPPNYIIALVYIASGSVLAWQASKKIAGRVAALCLITAYAVTMLFLFKHGFVRADLSHMRLFYSCVTPFLAILAVVSFSGFNNLATSKKVMLCAASLVLIVIYGIMLKFLPGETGPINLARNWLTCGNRLVGGIQGENTQEFAAKKDFVRKSQPQFFSWLNEYSRTFGTKGRKPRITFYPWEMLNFEGVDGYELAPSPSLQLYSTGPHTRTHRMEAEFLSSANRPDIVVIGPAAIDDRSPVSELTDLLPPLYSHFRVATVVDGFTILEADESGKLPESVIRYTGSPTGVAGDFLHISLDQPEAVNKLLWRLASTLFKSPELSVFVTLTLGNGEKVEYAWRGYLSQLQGGVLFSPATVPEFFESYFRTSAQIALPSPRSTSPIRSVVAEVRRSGGFWNLPVIPRVVPLKVKYGLFM